MSTATITAPVTVAAATDDVPSIDALAAAIAAVSVAGDTDKAAKASLARIVLERYKYRMARHVRTVDGVTVLPANKRKEVAALIWLDATESLSPPASADRTPGEKSLAQYVARYGTVATDLILGTQALADTETANKVYKSICEQNRADKLKDADAKAALDAIADAKAYREWLSAQPATLQTAFKHVGHALTGNPHLSAFIDSVTVKAEDSVK